MALLLWLLLMVAVFYLLIVRPQRRQMTALRALQGSLTVGDEVVTRGGLYGTVRDLHDHLVVIEIAPGTAARCARQAIIGRVEDEAGDGPGEGPAPGPLAGDA